MHPRVRKPQPASIAEEVGELVRARRLTCRRHDDRAGDAGEPRFFRDALARAGAKYYPLLHAAVDEVPHRHTRVHE
jgi:hypothetical protein